MPLPNDDDVRQALDTLFEELVAERANASHWTGQLSASALSTATAISAIAIFHREKNAASQALLCDQSVEKESISGAELSLLPSMIDRGIGWCLSQQNEDGGFGDTDRSLSNIATSILVRSAFALGRPYVPESVQREMDRADRRAKDYVANAGGVPALRKRYGKDKTFVIPILTNAALAGLVSWSEVQALPFELAAVPQRMYRAVRMPVVSYAIPALVAIGQARFYHRPPRNPVVYLLRKSAIQRTLCVLERMQPTSGGYLEATPLTSFVLMSLASIGRHDHPVAVRAVQFLKDSILEDGSWPIDTNLATWITSLSIHALAEAAPVVGRDWADGPLLDWLLGCQHLQRHPFTGADPGGWGWTNLSGAVPDGDDTPAAIIAIGKISKSLPDSDRRIAEMQEAAKKGVQWILALQNRDGGWPTFCRGWGKLPFDRSSSDLTAHSLRALDAAQFLLGINSANFPRWQSAVRKGWEFLAKSQRPDGSILPLWFGNQDQPEDENPFYGTSRVLLACETLREEKSTLPKIEAMLHRAAVYLISTQNQDGGWGGGNSLTRWLSRQGNPPRTETFSVDGPDQRNVPGDRHPAGKNHPTATWDTSSPPEKLSITSSVEESAIVIEAMSKYVIWLEKRSGNSTHPPNAEGNPTSGRAEGCREAIIRGVEFLCEAVRHEKHHIPWPIGFYFAKLWYHERLYATTFACAALGSVRQLFRRDRASIDDPH